MIKSIHFISLHACKTITNDADAGLKNSIMSYIYIVKEDYKHTYTVQVSDILFCSWLP